MTHHIKDKDDNKLETKVLKHKKDNESISKVNGSKTIKSKKDKESLTTKVKSFKEDEEENKIPISKIIETIKEESKVINAENLNVDDKDSTNGYEAENDDNENHRSEKKNKNKNKNGKTTKKKNTLRKRFLLKVKNSIKRIRSSGVYKEVIIDEEKMAYLNNTKFPPDILRLKRFFSDGIFFIFLFFSAIITLLIAAYALYNGNIYR